MRVNGKIKAGKAEKAAELPVRRKASSSHVPNRRRRERQRADSERVRQALMGGMAAAAEKETSAQARLTGRVVKEAQNLTSKIQYGN